MDNETAISGPSTSMIDKTTGAVIEKSELINSGQNTTVNKTYYNFNMEVFKVTDVIGYIAKPFVEFIRMNLSTDADVRERDPVEIRSLTEGDPSPLPVSSIGDRYTRSMLGCLLGYPLYEPEPFSEHSTEYLRNGVNIGDVGFVRKDGQFDFLFNICPTQNGLINPSNLPDGFCLLERSKTKNIRPLLRNTCLFQPPVMKTESGEYICKGSEGAVLVLPEGANREEAINEGWFEELAKLRGVEWYEYAKFRGRSISNGSLYLVTALTKCAQWGIAVFDRPCDPGQGLTFVSHRLGWKGSSAFPIRAADPDRGDIFNQCVFLQGYKIMIRPDIFDKLPTRQPAHRIRGGGGTGFLSRMKKKLLGESPLTRTTNPAVTKSDEVILHANFNSPPVHPSDLINAELLRQYPDAKVAITHDDVWCDLLRDNFPKLDYKILQKVALSYTSMINEYGCVSLEKNVPKTPPMEGSGWPGILMRSGGGERRFGAGNFFEAVGMQGGRNQISNNRSAIEHPSIADIQRNLIFDHSETPTVATETRSMTLFQGSSNVQISNTKFTTIGGDATIFQFGDGQFTEVQRNLICDYIATLAVLPDINNNLKKWHVLTQLIINLPRAEAVFNDYQTKKKSGPCFDGTRVALLREMANWVTGQDESRMYILSGLAGIGKSTVAYTIASRAANPKLNLLGASFFFSRDEADRNNAKKLFTTIAYQLCVYNERFAKAIGDVLETEHGSAATTKDPQEQLQVLILDPLRSIVQSGDRPILVVVDALDECDEDDVSAVVEGLSQLVRDLPSFKVILTTRPLQYLDVFLGNQGGHRLFHLQDIEEKIVDGDIRHYLKHKLSLEEVQKHYPRWQWTASDEQIDALVRAAGRLFIIASTAVRNILDKFASNPAAQMEKLLRACAQDHTPFKDLGHFYTIILRNIIPVDCDDGDIVSRYQSVIGAVIFVSRPLPVSTLACLIDMDVNDIHAVLDKLQSVILLGDDDVPRIYHKSFPDYLTDQARCKDSRLQIDPKIGHTQVATCCFKITNKHLKYNILDLGNVARYMNNEEGLKKDGITDVQLQEKIPPQLRYASVYWANHLGVGNIEDTGLMNGLEKFVDEHTLHWFEVLSLIGNLDSAHHSIRAVIKLLKSTSSDLHQLLSDAFRFISKFYELIKRSALHTYYSALPFSPTSSLLYRRYNKEARHNVCGIEGRPEKWDALVAHLNHGRSVYGIKFSLDSVLFVSHSEKHLSVQRLSDPIRNHGKLKIWDAATGTPISTVPGRRFAVTNNFSTVASSSDNIITYYNMDGSLRSTMITTSSMIEELALSESSRMASAFSDGTVCLWDSSNAKLIDTFDGFKSIRWSRLQFSPTGNRLAYSSANGIVKLRDGISGRFLADLQCGSSHKFEFSDDGFRIASLADDCGLTLWNTESGRLVGAIRSSGRNFLAISANGSLLATADLHNVTLWSENHDHLAEIQVLESRNVTSISFSLDNILAIGTRFAIKLYNTNTHSFISTLSFNGSPTALAFSPDCTRLAGATADYGNIYLWDMRGIDASSPTSQEATGVNVTAMALSRDCSRLACGLLDGTVELWETSPTKQRIASCKGDRVSAVGFGPDGRLFASGSEDGTIKLWNGRDGSLHGTLKASPGLRAVALSNSVLVVAGQDGVTLWSLDTLSLIHTFETRDGASTVSISDDSDLVAIAFDYASVHLVDVVNHTTIATFTVHGAIYKLSFLPDKSRIVAQTNTGAFLSLDLLKRCVRGGPVLKDLIQLPDTPRWHGVPVWRCWANEQCWIAALFSQHQTPVPVLWIPSDIRVHRWTQGSSMIALGCTDGRIMLLRLPTSHLS